MKSEFGKGLSYCLSLFLAHEFLHSEIRSKNDKIFNSIWFNGASDHLYDLVIPESLPKTLQRRLKKFRGKCLDLGHGSGLMDNSVVEEDYVWAVQEAKDLLRAIDRANGVKVVKGDWE
ncbi:MAG: hypothetical protein KAX49_13060 [Halanaerobiales bacterium]|nr:hypothetical protein [Halanaerobiales bacterium]